MRRLTLLCAALGSMTACQPHRGSLQPSAPEFGDAHVHLSLGAASDLDSLVDNHVTVVRDAGGDLAQLARWRHEIAEGGRRGPRIYVAGPLLDGAKADSNLRLVLRTVEAANAAVDSLAALGVDFLKTHNGLAPDVFFAVLRRARLRGLRVAAHLPRNVPAWVAADSGVGSIEHVAESLVASPIGAGFATNATEALAWWRSEAGATALRRIARRGVTLVPTLVRYEASIAAAATPELRDARAALFPQLLELTGAAFRAGVPLLVGSDLVGLPGARAAWSGPAREIELLVQSGIPRAAANAAARPERLDAWFRRR